MACEENKMIDRPHSYTAMITLELKHTFGDNKKLEYILRKYRDTTTLRRPWFEIENLKNKILFNKNSLWSTKPNLKSSFRQINSI